MNPFLERTGLVLWYIAWPFWKTLQLIYFLLKPLRYTLHILSLPFVYLSLFIYKAVRWPFDFLAKFEVSCVFVLRIEYQTFHISPSFGRSKLDHMAQRGNHKSLADRTNAG